MASSVCTCVSKWVAEIANTAVVGPDAPRIITPDQRPRVFVSSTLQELADERVAARAAIETLRLIPVMFELGARPHPARALYRAYLAQSHVFVGIYFARYGWVAPGEEVSGLEDEYTLSSRLPRLVYVKAPAPNRESRLNDLLSRIRDDDTVAYKAYGSSDELQQLLREDLAVLLAERFLLPPIAEESVGEPKSAAIARTTPVPAPLSSLIGRDREISAVEDLFTSGARLVTVVGPGGIGKTRVALEAARRLAERGTSPVSFVPLDAVDEHTAVLPEVAASIGLGLDGGLSALDALTAAFAERPFLLVVDNFEQVRAAAPDFAKLLAACPKLSVLVTSRVPLKVRGERLVPLGPLELPEGHDQTAMERSAAVRLFVDRATAVRPTFTLEDPGDRDAVIELCRRLDGIPLALELAAARSALLAPRALLDRIGTALDLGAGASDLPYRQRTMRDTLAWSLQLLSSEQSALLARLSVFVAPWTLSDAEAVADPGSGDLLDDIAALVENNLVAPTPDAPSEPRFRLYESVRAYAAELLDDAAREQVEPAYVQRLTGQAVELSRWIRSREHQRWLAEFRRVWPDLRRAWEIALRRRDAERTCLASAGVLPLWLDGSLLKAYDLIEPSVRLADEVRPESHGELLFQCALAAFHLGDYDRAGQFLGRIGADVAPPKDPDMVAGASLLRSYIAVAAGDLDTCERELRRSLELLQSRTAGGVAWLGAYVHNGFGELLAVRGDVAGAIGELTLSRELGHESGNVGAEMQALVFEAGLHLVSGRHDQARDLLEAASDLVELQPFYEGNAYFLEAVALNVAGVGHVSEAARLLGLAKALRDLVGARIWALLDPMSARIHDTVRSASDGTSFDAAFAEGRTLDPHTSAARCRAALRLPIADPDDVAAGRT
jgi:predicted ATPase